VLVIAFVAYDELLDNRNDGAADAVALRLEKALANAVESQRIANKRRPYAVDIVFRLVNSENRHNAQQRCDHVQVGYVTTRIVGKLHPRDDRAVQPAAVNSIDGG